MARVFLIFPPGWSSLTGGPHAAIGYLRSYLVSQGHEVELADLNWSAGELWSTHIRSDCAGAADPTSLESMNAAYFPIEDRVEEVARQFDGGWNLQLGFEYSDRPERSSARAYSAAARASPYSQVIADAASRIQRLRPDVVGISISATQQIVPTLQICRALRLAGYEGHIILGGNTVSRLQAEMATEAMFAMVDALVPFQGEEALHGLCDAIDVGAGLESVPGIIWFDGATVRRNKRAPQISPAQKPGPDYRGLQVGRYSGINYICMVGARGCYYGKCSFCAIPYGWGDSGYGGARPASLVYQDILLQLDRHGINRFKFVDEALSPSFMRELAAHIRADGLDIEWEGYVRLERAWEDADFVESVAAAGFRKGYFGLETVPSESRAALNKNDGADPSRLLAYCQEFDVKVHLFCMFGFPGTGRKDAYDTVDYLLSHLDQVDTADVFPWTMAKHTQVQGALPIVPSGADWVLEFDHRPTLDGALCSKEISQLTTECEEIIWRTAPRLLHPVYRLESPWRTRSEHVHVSPLLKTATC